MNRLTGLIFFLLLFNAAKSQTVNDSLACEIVNKKIKIIEQHLDNPYIITASIRAEAISFLENLTGIESEADGNYYGKTSPTINDLKRWKVWFEKNRSYLSFENSKRVIILKKEVAIKI